MNEVTGTKFWDDMYRSRTAPWDDEPNPQLASEVEGLVIGTALDVGCGEGSDAVWLATKGWRVTAVDISQVALDRGRAQDPSGKVEWLMADLLEWEPPADAYDLVSAHFMHLPKLSREPVFAGLARAVKANGTLLIVAHHPSDLASGVGRWPEPDCYYTPDEVAAALDPECWQIAVKESRPRVAPGHGGQAFSINDTIVRARRVK